MKYTGNRNKTKKPSHMLVWTGVLLLLSFGTILFLREKPTAKKSYISYKHFTLGDYSNLSDEVFCRNHCVKEGSVEKIYDEKRGTYVYYFSYKFGGSEPYDKTLSWQTWITCLVECNNKIVQRSEIEIRAPANAQGKKYLDGWVHSTVGRAEGDITLGKVVSSSQNVNYRGHDKRLILKAFNAAVLDVIKHGGRAMIQTKKSRFYVQREVSSWSNDGFGVTTIWSDQLLYNEHGFIEGAKDVLWDGCTNSGQKTRK